MMIETQDYVAGGYFLSRYVGPHDCTGIELRRISLPTDHSARKFFPGSWALSWCQESREQRIEEAAVFGITENDLDRVIEWADQSFDKAFGVWNVFFTLGAAQAAARLLKDAADLELWGAGLHRELSSAYCANSKPPPPGAGYAPIGASGVHVAACERSAPIAERGTILGYQILMEELGAFNSPESRHLDELAIYRAVGITPNAHGLIDSFDEALACCRHLDAHVGKMLYQITGWLPWLLVRYSLDR